MLDSEKFYDNLNPEMIEIISDMLLSADVHYLSV